MAKFKSLCPLCQAEIHVYTQWAGQQAVCPTCNGVITVPASEQDYPEELSHITTCPSCHATQLIPAEISDRSKRSCTRCGADFLYIPDISFKCAERLPPDGNGNARIACPFCGRHYVLKYSPHNNLIGCQECMNIFAHPDAFLNQTAHKKLPRPLSPIQITPEETPAQPGQVVPAPAPTPIKFAPAPAPMKVVQTPVAPQSVRMASREPQTIRIQPIAEDNINFLPQTPVQLKPVVPQEQAAVQPNAPAPDDEEEMIEIRHRSYKEPATVVLPDSDERDAARQTVSDKSLIRKFFGK